MRFSFSSGSFPTYSLPAIFEIGHEAGADAIEVMLSPRMVKNGPTRLRFLEDQFRLPIASLHSVMRLRETSPEQLKEDVLESARLARKLEHCQCLVVHLPGAGTQVPGMASWWLDAVNSAVEILASSGTSISIENPDPPADGERPDERLSLMRWRFVAKEFGLHATFDTSHAAASGWDLLEYAAEPDPELDNVHLSDVGGEPFASGVLNSLMHQHRPPGRGNLEIERFLARLPRQTTTD
ncbi:MAG: sugar phosphate isomerase/epimerase family protein [Chloroflexota bacterium]